MSKPNKYNQYISQQPTDGDPTSRAYKRRKWKESWLKFHAQDGMNFERWLRRESWKSSWPEFRDEMVEETGVVE